MNDKEIIALLPVWDRKCKLITGKGVVNPTDNKIVQFSVLGRVRKNWLGKIISVNLFIQLSYSSI